MYCFKIVFLRKIGSETSCFQKLLLLTFDHLTGQMIFECVSKVVRLEKNKCPTNYQSYPYMSLVYISYCNRKKPSFQSSFEYPFWQELLEKTHLHWLQVQDFKIVSGREKLIQIISINNSPPTRIIWMNLKVVLLYESNKKWNFLTISL